MKEDENLSENNPNKGEFLRRALLKEYVVFARTSPEQKLIIVDACQKLSHCVAVTGDGVNDCPAIKKADIGIAMGRTGSDVARDCADIILLDDNFANIVKGIKRGRVIFDTLKRIVGYNLTSNIPELLPFICLVIFQFPLSITTILILCIDVGTDIYPNITFSFEVPEDDIMKRPPRNIKTDRLCSLRLFGLAYLFNGFIQSTAAFLSYFVIMNDYGFKPENLFYYVLRKGYLPYKNDVYNPYDEYKGNSIAFIANNANLLGIKAKYYEQRIKSRYMKISWDSDSHLDVDQRIFFFYLNEDFWSSCNKNSRGMQYDGIVCWRVEALRHAQGGFLLAVIVTQITNSLIWRTKVSSIFKHKMTNHPLNLSYMVEFVMIILLLYVPVLYSAFDIRPLRIEHFLPAVGMSIVWFFYSEFTKWLVRNIRQPDNSPGFFYKAFCY